MSKKYKLSYTAVEIDEKLGAVNQISKDVEQLSTDVEQFSDDVEQLSKDVNQLSDDVGQLSDDFNISKTHANQHSSGGTDPISPEDIGAMLDVPVTTSDNGKFLCVVNGDWAAVNAVIGDNADGISVAEKAVRDGNGNVIVDTYETKTDANAKLEASKSYTDTAIESAFANVVRAEQMSF